MTILGEHGHAVKLCTVCGVVTSRVGSRCTEHARQSNRR